MENNQRNQIYHCLAQVLQTQEQSLLELDEKTKLEEIGLDSIQFLRFIILLEDTFSITFQDSDLLFSNFDTLDSIFRIMARYLQADMSRLKKCLVLDCDQVLWKGIAAEDGIENLVVNQVIQEAAVKLYKKGILICICSKNDRLVISQVFKSMVQMPLKKEHIILRKVNWKPKTENLIDLSERLDLSLDSFVFVDDSRHEIGLIHHFLPEVTTVLAEGPEELVAEKILACFPEKGMPTQESKKRTLLYKQQKAREKGKMQFDTPDEYNLFLETKVAIHHNKPSEAARIQELFQRTNQFNLSSVRYRLEEVKERIQSDDYEVISLTASDKYGKMGIVAACVMEIGEEAVLEAFALSCRAFGRGFEERLLKEARRKAEQRGAVKCSGVFIANEKNQSRASFYTDHGIKVLHRLKKRAVR